MVIAACRIKPSTARGAPRITFQVFANGHLRAARPAENRSLVPLLVWPGCDRMASQRYVAVLASVVDPAALHFDGHNIQRRAIVRATRLTIHFDPAHITHRLRLFRAHYPPMFKNSNVKKAGSGHCTHLSPVNDLPQLRFPPRRCSRRRARTSRRRGSSRYRSLRRACTGQRSPRMRAASTPARCRRATVRQ